MSDAGTTLGPTQGAFMLADNGFWLTASRRRFHSDSLAMWRIEGRDGTVAITTPDGSARTLRIDGDPLTVLRQVAASFPGICDVLEREVLELECSPEIEGALPLWLRVVETGGVGSGEIDPIYEEDLDNGLSWAPHSSEHFVFVNGLQWGAIPVKYHLEAEKFAMLPIRGNWIDDLFIREYASFGFSETASMTSGRDSSRCGLVAPGLFGFVDRFDQGETLVTLRVAGTEVDDLRSWIWGSELADQLRDTWSIAAEDDDFIEWGLLQLVNSGRSGIDVRGLHPDAEDDLGVGLTSSSEWSFGCKLPLTTLRAALGQLADRRPGGGPEPTPMFASETPLGQLEEALELPEAELDALGWKRAVEVDREFGIKIFNVTAEPRLSGEIIEDIRAAAGAIPAEAPALETVCAETAQTIQEAWIAVTGVAQGHPELRDRALADFWRVLEARGVSMTAELKRELEWALEIEGSAREFGWPSEWDPRLCQLWVRNGGTAKSARAWAGAGWEFRSVLMTDRLSRYWNPSVQTRVKTVTVRKMQDFDLPDDGSHAVPPGEITVGEFLQAVQSSSL